MRMSTEGGMFFKLPTDAAKLDSNTSIYSKIFVWKPVCSLLTLVLTYYLFVGFLFYCNETNIGILRMNCKKRVI